MQSGLDNMTIKSLHVWLDIPKTSMPHSKYH